VRVLRPLALAIFAVLLFGGAAFAAANPGAPASEAAPQLRHALVARDGAGAFVIVRLTGDLARRGDGSVRASLAVAGRTAGRVSSLDRVSFRHYCFRATLRRPWPAFGRRVGVAVRAPTLRRVLRTVTVVRRARGNDRIGARLGCRLPNGTA
jgi:hypothetical protein